MDNKIDDIYIFNKQVSDEVLLDGILNRLAKIEGITMLVVTSDALECDPKHLINCFWAVGGLAKELIEISEEVQGRFLLSPREMSQ